MLYLSYNIAYLIIKNKFPDNALHYPCQKLIESNGIIWYYFNIKDTGNYSSPFIGWPVLNVSGFLIYGIVNILL